MNTTVTTRQVKTLITFNNRKNSIKFKQNQQSKETQTLITGALGTTFDFNCVIPLSQLKQIHKLSYLVMYFKK